MFLIKRRLCKPESQQKRRNEAKALKEAYPDPTSRFDFLYGNLSIIDSKASTLLTFNAIGLTVLAVWLQNIPPNWLHFALDTVFVVFLISSAYCLGTAWLFWSPPSDYEDRDTQTLGLLEKRDFRTSLYHTAWKMASVAVVSLLLISIFHGIGTYMIASETCGENCRRIFSQNNWGMDTSEEKLRVQSQKVDKK